MQTTRGDATLRDALELISRVARCGPRIWENRRRVNRLSASWRMKGRACCICSRNVQESRSTHVRAQRTGSKRWRLVGGRVVGILRLSGLPGEARFSAEDGRRERREERRARVGGGEDQPVLAYAARRT